ncbi:MAG: translocation/assembly module TamB domain-containing protein [Candidatus Azobacteroides sp.]|nr:translocation/assembly module TamB domain-containing protein [Candidatus Azobacteroides sp.]
MTKRKVKKIILISLASIFLLIAGLFVAISLPPVQQWIKNILVRELSAKINSTFRIDKISLRLPNSLNLSGVYVEDLSKDTLLYAREIDAKFNLLPLLKNELQINKVLLSDFLGNINQDSLNGPMNFQFIIDAFASQDTTPKESGALTFNMEEVILENGRLNYYIKSEAETPEIFNTNHISVSGLQANLAVNYSDLENFKLNLKEFRLHEHSGTVIEDLTGKVNGSGKKITLEDLTLRLPHSHLHVQGNLDYEGKEIEAIADSGNIYLEIDHTYIALADLKSFSPSLSNFTDSLIIQGTITAPMPAINLEDLKVSMGNVSLNANAFISNYQQLEQATIKAEIADLNFNESDIRLITRNLMDESLDLPEEIKNLGNINIKGNLSGTIENMLLALNLRTAPGDISVKGTAGYIESQDRINYDVDLTGRNFRLDRLLGDDMFGNVSLESTITGNYANDRIVADVNASIPLFDYEDAHLSNIHLKAQIDGDNYNILFNMNNELGYINLDGKASLSSSLLSVNAVLDAKDVALGQLIDLPEYPNSKVSFFLTADMAGKDLDNITGKAVLDSIYFVSDSMSFRTTALTVSAAFQENGDRLIDVDQEFLHLTATGKISFDVIADQLMATANEYLPSLIMMNRKTKLPVNENNFHIHLTVNNTERLTRIFDLPFTVVQPANLDFSFNDTGNFLQAQLNLPQGMAGETILDNLNLSLSNMQGPLTVNASAIIPDILDDTIQVNLDAKAIRDSILIHTLFDNKTDTFVIKGNLDNVITLRRTLPNDPLTTTVAFNPSTLTLNTMGISVSPSTITLMDGRIDVRNFRLSHHEGEYISANGVYSNTGSDTLYVEINQLHIEDITDALNMSYLGVGGLIQGRMAIVGSETLPSVFANPLNINDIALNNEEIGNLQMASVFSSGRNFVGVRGTLERTDGGENSTISGAFFPETDSVRVRINLNDIHLSWLQPFLQDVLYNLGGDIKTDLVISGKTNAPEINGTIYVDDARFGIDLTDVTYVIEDSISVTPDKIDIHNMSIVDPQGKAANLTGTVTHHNFQNLNYNFSMRIQDFLVLNNINDTDSLFFGLVRLSGSITGEGNDTGVNLNMNLQNSTNSRIAVILPSNLTADEHPNIIFVDHRTDEENDKIQRSANLPVDMKITMNVNPNMEFTVYLDPSLTSRAVVTGTGNINFTYNLASSSMELFGNYTIEQGSFIYNLQNITRRKFQIMEGSTVNFNGDPMKTSFNIVAQYSLRADLSTLDQSFASDPNLQSGTRVDVNCILTIQGSLDKVDISYDIELPDVSQDVQQNVKSYMSTEDVLIKEFAYLLALGSFYTPDYATAASSNNSIVNSFASSTLTSTLNGLIGGILGKNVSLSTNINSIDNSNLDVDVTLTTRLFNDRLIINTNVEYNNASANNTTVVGDFDTELKLNKSGNLRLKAYNKTNDEYYQKAPTTQGIGLVYTKEAMTFKNLFKNPKRRNRGQSDRNTQQ